MELRCRRCSESVSGGAAGLEAHLRAELGLAPFQCALCLRRFRSDDDANRHFEAPFTHHPSDTIPVIIESPEPEKEAELRRLLAGVEEEMEDEDASQYFDETRDSLLQDSSIGLSALCEEMEEEPSVFEVSETQKKEIAEGWPVSLLKTEDAAPDDIVCFKSDEEDEPLLKDHSSGEDKSLYFGEHNETSDRDHSVDDDLPEEITPSQKTKKRQSKQRKPKEEGTDQKIDVNSTKYCQLCQNMIAYGCESRRRHIREHHVRKPVATCNLCGVGCLRRYSMKLHIQSVHDIKYDEKDTTSHVQELEQDVNEWMGKCFPMYTMPDREGGGRRRDGNGRRRRPGGRRRRSDGTPRVPINRFCALCSKKVTVTRRQHILEIHVRKPTISCNFCGAGRFRAYELRGHIERIHHMSFEPEDTTSHEKDRDKDVAEWMPKCFGVSGSAADFAKRTPLRQPSGQAESRFCFVCDMAILSVNRVQHIIEQHLKKSVVVCKACGSGAMRLHSMKIHVERVHGKPFTEAEYTSHIDELDEEATKLIPNFFHPSGAAPIPSEEALLPKRSRHRPPPPSPPAHCALCDVDVPFSTRRAHITMVHVKLPLFTCKLCGAGKRRIHPMKLHIRSRHKQEFDPSLIIDHTSVMDGHVSEWMPKCFQ